MILPHCSKIEVRKSPIEGYGVFATQPIAKGEVLEEVPFILFPRYSLISKNVYGLLKNDGFLSEKEAMIDNLRLNLKFKDPEKYYFKWFPEHSPSENFSGFNVLPLGFGPIYNSSNTDNNANWRVGEDTFTFYAEKDIEKDEEICTFYGYFVDEMGNTFNAEDVFHAALDDNGVIKAFRFGNESHLESFRKDSFYLKFTRFLEESQNGLKLTSICAANAAGQQSTKFIIPPDAKISSIYQKLFEYKRSNMPFTHLEFSFYNKEGLQKLDGVVLKN